MKIAAISDTRQPRGVEAVLADIRKRGVDLIVNLGDILSGAAGGTARHPPIC